METQRGKDNGKNGSTGCARLCHPAFAPPTVYLKGRLREVIQETAACPKPVLIRLDPTRCPLL